MENVSKEDERLILITGSTGYVGGVLLRELEKEGLSIRCLARRPEMLENKVATSTEVVRGDVLDSERVKLAMEGVHTAYYLIHSMGSAGNFEEKDRRAARNFGETASHAGVNRIIFLGGLGGNEEPLSEHLRSRQEVGEILRVSGVQVIEFRASIVIGSGSISFEMIRGLVERLPVMVTPKWVSTPAQPIYISDLVDYLVAALDKSLQGNRIFEIGGPDVVSYGDCMREYANLRGLRRIMIPVPPLTPWLSSLWLGLVTPLYARVGRRLIESIRHPTIVNNRSALDVFNLRPMGLKEAISSALRESGTGDNK